ncbi:uncharacterized protein PV09_04954 [Verruconis gallopava]|uniref:Uncharacterized protein n=1 Tax=Verruconis gallopava TaxID=253628 RepID=A0A0D1XNJ7_9PEZI|nr:uncharacterized protein PV09_04954 [Verruconis gallopava]KIW04146.1 hypothetical protein PV09_04954 [Verruconis gallopava]
MSTDEGKSGAQTLESVGPKDNAATPRSFGQKAKHFLKRFWWLLVAVTIVIVLVVVLCVVFVGIPNIAQKAINEASLTLESQVVTFPQPDSIHVMMNTTVTNPSSYHPQLYSFQAALFLEDTEPDIKPFGYIEIPAAKAESTFSSIINQQMNITDQEQFARYNQLVLSSETYRVALRGRIPLKEGGLPKTTVNFNHVVESKGLNNLQGFEIQNISISLVAEADGTNMRAQAFIPNPSPITIEMGTVTQNVYVGNNMIAVATLPELVLKPGDNLVNLTSVANQTMVLSLITTQYQDAKLPVRIVGNNSTANGQDLPYFTAALKAQTLETTLDLGPALKAAGITLK